MATLKEPRAGRRPRDKLFCRATTRGRLVKRCRKQSSREGVGTPERSLGKSGQVSGGVPEATKRFMDSRWFSSASDPVSAQLPQGGSLQAQVALE
ncbi:hypothetical protein L596_007916 [Steinernema carpocapsae]|uniref:Uncharacterized protein n=1 Tax=Steinernema carpocapsae TaxID=34508 RepID=A0A4U5PAY3_STECR|nr:hypothetical protein L596_007916 [Steinernema carpocapsae]